MISELEYFYKKVCVKCKDKDKCQINSVIEQKGDEE